MDPDIDVIIPTTGEPARERSLLRAIDSVVHQENVRARPIVVLNGNRASREFVHDLTQREDIRLERQTTPSLPQAIRRGREFVRSEYFAFLDDDDEYLQGALSCRLRGFLEDEHTALVVSNGYKRVGEVVEPLYPSMRDFSRDPLFALVDANWLASCGGLYKSAPIGTTFFDPEIKYFEWTSVAFQIAISNLKIKFIEDMTFRINETEGSLSLTDDYILAAPEFVDSLLRHDLPRHIRNGFERKKRNLEHAVSKHFLSKGDKKMAMNYHLRSMRGVHGFLRHAPFTSNILFS